MADGLSKHLLRQHRLLERPQVGKADLPLPIALHWTVLDGIPHRMRWPVVDDDLPAFSVELQHQQVIGCGLQATQRNCCGSSSCFDFYRQRTPPGINSLRGWVGQLKAKADLGKHLTGAANGMTIESEWTRSEH